MLPMKNSYTRVLAPLLLIAGVGPAFAQVYQYQPVPIQWFVEAGPSFTVGTTSDYLNDGWTVGTGFLVHPEPSQPLSLRVDFNYSHFGATNQLITEGEYANQTNIDGGNAQIVSGHVGGQFEAPLNPWMRFYATAGVGIAWRRIDLTENGYGLCNPYFGYGYCGGYGYGGYVVARYDTTKFAWNAGLGLDFPLPGGQSWFVESRFERMETPTPTEIVPVRFGFRF
jgi:opacity protein-like surface antigen